jgi:amino acid transporter
MQHIEYFFVRLNFINFVQKNLIRMNQDTFIYTLPQWFIFASILVTVYGWVESKKYFRIIGSVVMILLGVFAVWAIVQGYFSANNFLTPDELISEEMEEEVMEEMPFQAQLLPAYWSFIVAAVLSLPAIYFDWKNKKPNRLFYILAGLVALLGFFIIVGALKMM